MKYDFIIFTDFTSRISHAKSAGAYTIASAVRAAGFTCKVVDYFGNWIREPDLFWKLLDSLVGPNTLAIGFSSTFYSNSDLNLIDNDDFSVESLKLREYRLTAWPTHNKVMSLIIKRIKNKFPNVSLIYGGIYDNRDPKLEQLSGLVDYVAIGLADNMIVDLLNHLKSNTPLKYMRQPGINLRILNYDSKAVNYDFVNSQLIYTEDDDIFDNEHLTIEMSRGCLFHCDFCSYPLLGRKKNDPAYIKSVESIAAELRRNHELFGTTSYSIVDDTFNESVNKIEHALRARDLSKVDFKFKAYIRLDLVARFPEQIKLLKELGIQLPFFGIESLHWPSAKSIGKGIHPEKAKETLYKVKDAWGNNTIIHGHFIIGLPEDNYDTLSEWLPWVESNDCPIDSVVFNTLGLAPGSKMADNYQSYGYEKTETGNWKNKYWSEKEVNAFVNNLDRKLFNSGRAKVGGSDLYNMVNIGYPEEELIGLSWNKVDYPRLFALNKAHWIKYRDLVVSKHFN